MKVRNFEGVLSLVEGVEGEVSFSRGFSPLEAVLVKRGSLLTVDPLLLISLVRTFTPVADVYLNKKLVVWFSPSLKTLYENNKWIETRVPNLVFFCGKREDFLALGFFLSSRIALFLENEPLYGVLTSFVELLQRELMPLPKGYIKRAGDPLDEIWGKREIVVPEEQRKSRFKAFPLLKLLTGIMVEEVARWGQIADKSAQG